VHVRVASLSKTGLVIYGRGREDLIFNVSFTLESTLATSGHDKDLEEKPATESAGNHADARALSGAKKEKTSLPAAAIKELAWIVPTPSLPLSYGQVDDRCFRELDDLLPIYKSVKTGGGLGGFGGNGSADPNNKGQQRSLLAYPPQAAGDYTIQPLRAIGPDGVRALKDWLAKNGFVAMNDSALSYYGDHDWTFLAIKANLKGWKAGQRQTLAPLRISFPTNRIVFPMKMASGKINATLFVLSDAALPDPANLLNRFNFRLEGAKPLARKSLEGASLSSLWQQSALKDMAGAYLYRYTTLPAFLSDGVDPSKFATDVIFP
jgi:hypothetical protein